MQKPIHSLPFHHPPEVFRSRNTATEPLSGLLLKKCGANSINIHSFSSKTPFNLTPAVVSQKHYQVVKKIIKMFTFLMRIIELCLMRIPAMPDTCSNLPRPFCQVGTFLICRLWQLMPGETKQVVFEPLVYYLVANFGRQKGKFGHNHLQQLSIFVQKQNRPQFMEILTNRVMVSEIRDVAPGSITRQSQ